MPLLSRGWVGHPEWLCGGRIQEPVTPQTPSHGCTVHQDFFCFLAPHSHLATTPSSFPQSHREPRVTTSRNEKTSSRYCSYQGCWKAWGLRCAAPPVCRTWLIQPTSLWLGVRGWERMMVLAATAADLYLLAETEAGVAHAVSEVLETCLTRLSPYAQKTAFQEVIGLALPSSRWDPLKISN